MKFEITDPRALALSSADPRMGLLIRFIGDLEIRIESDPFVSLVRSIISQQISVKAAATIRGRVLEVTGAFTPEAIHQQEDEALRTAGLSAAKVVYLRDLCSRILAGQLDFNLFPSLTNEEIIQALTAVKGIGRWTAEMFLIFAMGRYDVVSNGDAGLQRAARWLHGLEERKDKKYLEQISHLWTPYGAIAGLYLWEAINCGAVDGSDNLEHWIFISGDRAAGTTRQ
ncbi:DNA-3-methyladenine glycosylase family protein [Paenibacillus tuaregi]|uniref:DNA-3-methyladenine glycosylase family protein n=1 Tax=Paenibacillus tuaregi TaxID=1816681 RepID=UPI0008384DB0|nr:DNA-3-methyladenine glycosylase [Paenibacillus tuaregi]